MSKFVDEPFDDEERALMEAVESGNVTPAADEAEILQAFKKAYSKNVTIRMQNSDVSAIKERAAEAGIPYQTLINSVIHRYVTGALVPAKSI